MKMKEIGQRGDARPRHPLGSANGLPKKEEEEEGRSKERRSKESHEAYCTVLAFKFWNL